MPMIECPQSVRSRSPKGRSWAVCRRRLRAGDCHWCQQWPRVGRDRVGRGRGFTHLRFFGVRARLLPAHAPCLPTPKSTA